MVARALMLDLLLGVVLGAAAGAIAVSLADAGIENQFIRNLAKGSIPVSSALFTLAVKAQPGKVIDDLQGFGDKILVTSLDKE